MPDPLLSRRRVLAAVALLGPVASLAACSTPAQPLPSATPTLTGLSDRVAAEESGLIALYDAVIARHADLATALQPIRDQHRDHRAALDVPEQPPLTPASPADRDEALHALIVAERAALPSRIDACVEAEDPELARTLAFIAASEGSHVPALRRLRP